ncbi:putative Metabotropic glutamate receptor 3-like 3 [Homarus americanus]|uniref:Putative Metabotropic glutamate receptor 3-like 3 n=1 Tax=Homarus americanus TaxID=6706 RepID=A0A8J5TLK4_HOMAM|nr:putative Metabotropic glutamate receptor 3-like 3 [Homarus americanus]
MRQTASTWAWVCVVLVLCGRWAAGGCVAEGDTTVHRSQGDAVITQLLPLHHGPQCDQLGLTEVQVLEATKMAVQRVNKLGLIPGVTLGPGDTAAATAVGSATQSLGTPVVAYTPRLARAPHTVDFLTPAPQRSAQAAVHVLSGVGVDAINIVHTADIEGVTLTEHFITAAEYVYICVEKVLEEGDTVGLTQVLEDGPGTLVILGTRHKVQSLALALGTVDGPVDLLLLVESGGPVPQVELAGLEVPALIMTRIVPSLSEFVSFLERDLESDDDPRRHYLAALSECESCGEVSFGYVADANSAIASVLVYAEALKEAQDAHCGGEAGLCHEVKTLDISTWNELLSSASLVTSATKAFPGLLNDNLAPGSEDKPRYTVQVLAHGSLTQVGQAEESSAVLGMLELPEPNCGTQCPCSLPPPALTLPPVRNVTHASSGFDIMGGAEWWNWEAPNPGKMSKRELAVYFTAFTLLVLIFITSCGVCLYSLNKTPSRS